MDQRTDRRTDKVSYRVTLPRLKSYRHFLALRKTWLLFFEFYGELDEKEKSQSNKLKQITGESQVMGVIPVYWKEGKTGISLFAYEVFIFSHQILASFVSSIFVKLVRTRLVLYKLINHKNMNLNLFLHIKLIKFHEHTGFSWILGYQAVFLNIMGSLSKLLGRIG